MSKIDGAEVLYVTGFTIRFEIMFQQLV